MWNTLEREFSPWPWAKCTYFDFNSFKHIQKYQVYSWDYCILFWQGFHLVWDIKTIKSYFKILLINLFPKNMKIPILTSFDRTFKTIQPNVTPRLSTNIKSSCFDKDFKTVSVTMWTALVRKRFLQNTWAKTLAPTWSAVFVLEPNVFIATEKGSEKEQSEKTKFWKIYYYSVNLFLTFE